MRSATLRDHNVQLERAFTLIRTHLSQPLDLSELARFSGYSQRHFVRLFQARTGESPFQYIQRQRLKRATSLLQRTRRHVLAIALEVGFAGPEVFCRAFQRTFGQSPTTFRRNFRLGRTNQKDPAAHVRLLLAGHFRGYVERRSGFDRD